MAAAAGAAAGFAAAVLAGAAAVVLLFWRRKWLLRVRGYGLGVQVDIINQYAKDVMDLKINTEMDRDF